MSDLVQLLRDCGMTQRALARELGVRPATVCFWMHRKVVPRAVYMHRIAEITRGGLPISVWFEGMGTDQDGSGKLVEQSRMAAE